MSYSEAGLNAAVDGIAALGTHLAANTADPGTTGAGVDTAVTLELATWDAASGGSADSVQVEFDVPSGGGARTYSHFSVWDGADTATAVYVTGGALDQDEVFSDNGGTLRFTGTLSAEDDAPVA